MFIGFKVYKTINTILKNKESFVLFTQVYIFGSSLNKLFPNDIDLLLIYKDFNDKILFEKNKISDFLENILKIPIDITMLSESELKETKFLKNTYRYKKIK